MFCVFAFVLLFCAFLGSPFRAEAPVSNMALAVDLTAEAIRKRAREISEDGVYIGLFELAAYSVSKNRRVFACMGDKVLDVGAIFAPTLAPAVVDEVAEEFDEPIRVCGVKMVSELNWEAAAKKEDSVLPDINHWVIAKKVPHVKYTTLVRAVNDWWADKSKIRDAKTLAYAAGLLLMPTNTAGNCGIDALGFFEQKGRTPESFDRIRGELAGFMNSIADLPVWHDVYIACEGDDHLPQKEKKKSAKTVAASSLVGHKGCGETGGSASETASSLPLFGGGGATSLSTGASPKKAVSTHRIKTFSKGMLAKILGMTGAAEKETKKKKKEPPPGKKLVSVIGEKVSPSKPDAEMVDVPVPSADVVAASTGDTLTSGLAGGLEPTRAESRAIYSKNLAAIVGQMPEPSPDHTPSMKGWLEGLPQETQKDITSTYGKYKSVERLWVARFPRIKKAAPPARKRHNPSDLERRRLVALRFIAWLQADGKKSRQPLTDFMLLERRYDDGTVPKKDKQWLKRAFVQFSDPGRTTDLLGRPFAERSGSSPASAQQSGSLLALAQRRGGVRTDAEKRTPSRLLKRARGTQGRKFKAPDIQEELWQWFLTMRASFATTVSAHFILMKAHAIAHSMLQAMVLHNTFWDIPAITPSWLDRFKARYGIVWRYPNAKYKLNWDDLRKRCVATWLNLIRVQRFALFVLARTLFILGIDEKPMHFNEAGSKNVRTLELVGAQSVPLKTKHADTRERCSVLTSVTDDPALASCFMRPPLEIMFKAKTNQRIRNLLLPRNRRISVTYGPSGSYREADIISYLGTHLEEWTPERAASRDYKILMLDVAKSHVGESVVDFAWSRGYLTLYHYGGITGVLQVNDTDLHVLFEREFLRLEEVAFQRRAAIAPWDIGRTPQQVLDDVCTAWDSIDHLAVGVNGHLHTGLSFPTDGEEENRDRFVARAAREVWDSVGMNDARLRAIAEVDATLEAMQAEGKPIDMSMWRQFVQHPDNPGILPEGFEQEGELKPGEKPWIVPDIVGDAEERALDATLHATAGGEDTRLLQIVPGADDDPAVVAKAKARATHMALLEKIQALGREAGVPVREAAKHLNLLKRGREGESKESQRADALVRESFRERQAADAEKIRVEREAAALERASALEKRDADKVRKAAEAVNKAADQERKKKMAALPKEFSIEDLGHEHPQGGTKAHANMRMQALERLKLRSPPLPLGLEARWKSIKEAYAIRVGKEHKTKVGIVVSTAIEEVKKRLGKHLKDADADAAAGDPGAFEAFVDSIAPEKLKVKVLSSVII